MGRPTCETCRYNGGVYSQPDDRMDEPAGLKCVRRSPTATGGMMSSATTIWPKVLPHDWCGEHTPSQPHKDETDDQ